MNYYTRKIEQIRTEDGYNEYATITKNNDYNTALSGYYQSLSNVASSSDHVYFNIQLINSQGNVLKDEIIGAYVVPEEEEGE